MNLEDRRYWSSYLAFSPSFLGLSAGIRCYDKVRLSGKDGCRRGLQPFVGVGSRGDSESTSCGPLQIWNRLIEWRERGRSTVSLPTSVDELHKISCCLFFY